jgi:hypothetical protein
LRDIDRSVGKLHILNSIHAAARAPRSRQHKDRVQRLVERAFFADVGPVRRRRLPAVAPADLPRPVALVAACDDEADAQPVDHDVAIALDWRSRVNRMLPLAVGPVSRPSRSAISAF